MAECSQSNYPTTKFSVSSLMNMNYLQDEFPNQDILPPLSASKVSQQLRSMGYTFLRFEHYSEAHFDLKEDILLSRNDAPLKLGLFTQGMNEFEAMLVETTALRVFFDMPKLLPGVDFSRAKYREHYLQTQYILDTLPNIPEMGSPRFVYAHLLVPHDPYIFTPDGRYKETTSTIRGYRDNVQFIDQAILPVLKRIIENSSIPPIILLQGDHGPSGKIVTPEMRLAILNAYFVSPEAAGNLYPTITPVNSFRVIFNEYFDGSYSLLEDRSYYAYEPEEFDPKYLIPNTCAPSDQK